MILRSLRGSVCAAGLLSGLLAIGCGGNGGTGSGEPEDSGGAYVIDAGHTSMTDGSSSGSMDSSAAETGTGTGDGAVAPDAGFDAALPPDDAGPWVTSPASLVNTLVGTTGGGNTFPGADYPFGMIQWSPDTAPNGLGTPTGGYDYGDTQLKGFSLTHLSGPGCTGYGDLPILPLVGGLPANTDPGSILEPLTHTTEVGNAGYYSLQSGSAATGGVITTELTATLHSAMARFTYPATTNANIVIKLLGSQNGDNGSSATIVGTNEIQGSTTESSGFCGVAGSPTVYFDIVFDQPFSTTPQILKDTAGTLDSVVFLTFDTTTTQVVQAKVAISFVSAAKAAANWAAENPSTTWNFAATEAAAQTAWNQLLGEIQVAGGSATQNQLFYTALYHSLLHPNVFSDADGEYLGFDQKTHTVTSPQQAQYANYSGWDIYRGQAQLSALLAPQQMSDSAQSMINDAAQNGGMLPKWASLNVETYVMVGDPADGILAGYYAFGARNFDTATALTDMIQEATVANNIRPGLDYYEQYGYLPDDGTYGCCNYNGSVSTTLEYAQADFAISQLASALGDTSHAATFLARAQNWQNLYNPANLMFTPRYLNGTFMEGIGRTFYNVASSAYQPEFVEGSAGQYAWEQPFNRQSLLTAMGGPSVVNPLLATYFTQLNDDSFESPYADLTNEQDIGQQYWNSYTGQPWMTEQIVNRVRTQVFADQPLMINNNDDLGAMSSMLAWSMLGIYPNYPGSAVMDLSAPSFPAVLIHLPNGNSLRIEAPGADAPDDAGASTMYVQSINLNGTPSTASWVDAPLIQNGGTLFFFLGTNPSMTWGMAASDVPPSYGVETTAAIGSFPSPLVIPTGTQVTADIGAVSTRADVAQTVSWELAADAGSAITVSPTSGQLSLPAGGPATQTVTFTAPQANGTYLLPFGLTSSTGNAMPSSVLTVIVAPAGSLGPYYNNAGISSDTTGTGDFDGSGYSYSAQALQAAGVTPGSQVVAGGMTFYWPNVASGAKDNVQAAGQTITFAATSVNTKIGLLGSATQANGSGAQGTLTVTYTGGGGTQSIPITFTDWTEGGGGYPLVGGNQIAATTAYRDNGTTKDTTKAYVYALVATLTGTTPVQSVTLPAQVTGGSINLFDIVLAP